MEQKNLVLLEKLKDWISKNHKDKNHLLAMEKWIKVVYPPADDALIIAAVAHDLERAFPLEEGEEKPERKGWEDENYREWHRKRSARYTEGFLLNNNADQGLVSKIKMLIETHGLGGDEERDALNDADSISFLENSAEMVGDSLEKGRTIEEIHDKFDIMYNRISSQENKQMAQRYYEEVIQKLETI